MRIRPRRVVPFGVALAVSAGSLTTGVAVAAASTRSHSPTGAASVHVVGRTVEFTGWAVDRDALSRRLTIVRLVDGFRVGAGATTLPNAAVTKRYHASSRPAFDVRITVANNGRAHTACVAAANAGGGPGRLLKCVTVPAHEAPTVRNHSPFGWTKESRHGTYVTYSGRATDPDFRNRPATVVLYIDGYSADTVVSHRVSGHRASGVGKYSAYALHATVAANQAHVGCVWAVDVGPGSNRLLGCSRFDVKSHATDRESSREARIQNGVVALAKKQFDKRYVFGNEGPNTFDCSGLVQWTYKKNGMSVPRIAEWQYQAAHIIPASHARPGDLVFYYNHEGYVHHVGIYVARGMTVAAMSPELGIGYQPIPQTPTWDGSYVSYGSFAHT